MKQKSSLKFAVHSATKILVDYFCFTVSYDELIGYRDPDECKGLDIGRLIERKFFFSGMAFLPRKGMYGYNLAAYYDGIIYAYGGASTVYIQMSGTGCRTWEDYHPGLSWERLIRYLQDTYKSLHISRLDIACDTFGLLKIKTIQAFTRTGLYISRWKTYLIQEGLKENSVIWGSSKSDFRLRIYDKTLERQVKAGVDPDPVPKGWIRCEFQLRNDSASVFVREWQRTGNLGETFMGILRNQLLYCTQYDGKNRDRAVLAPWWERLLGDSQQIKMAYHAGKDYNFDSLKRYLFRQVGPSLKTYLTIMDGDIDPLLHGIAGSRMNDRQEELVRSALPQQRQRQLDFLALNEEYQRLLQDVGS